LTGSEGGGVFYQIRGREVFGGKRCLTGAVAKKERTDQASSINVKSCSWSSQKMFKTNLKKERDKQQEEEEGKGGGLGNPKSFGK